MNLSHNHIYDFLLAKVDHRPIWSQEWDTDVFKEVENPIAKEKWRTGTISAMYLPLYGFVSFMKNNIYAQFFAILVSQYPSRILQKRRQRFRECNELMKGDLIVEIRFGSRT